ncbi:MAG TPA: biotin--[acetyl-CoA-carboxylase] ligase [Pseudonocardiaceae bacterium]|nr:biotin--[acetyl-CoA-carboxylase] ligase [Pseudonocardiaceae bacterium]
MDADRLRAELAGRYAAVDVVASTGSTNRDLAAAARDGAADRTVLIADEQTAGQGRLARTWASPPDAGLYLSVLLRLDMVPVVRLSWLAPLAGVALVRTARFAGAEAVLKWPNDLLIGSAHGKGAGVLAEVGEGSAVVIGIGLNVLPVTDIEPGAGGLPAMSLAGAGATVLDRGALATRLLTELADLDDAWRTAGGDPDASGLAEEYHACCDTFGQRVRVELPTGALTGVATHLSPEGALVVRTDDGRDHPVSAGDVVHLRSAS